MFVYTIQPVVNPVVQPGLTTGWKNSCSFNTVVKPVRQPAVSCIQTFNRLSNRVCQTSCTTRFDNRLNEHLFVQHGCQSVQHGWMFVYTIQPVVKPVVQPVVSCKRVLTRMSSGTSYVPKMMTISATFYESINITDVFDQGDMDWLEFPCLQGTCFSILELPEEPTMAIPIHGQQYRFENCMESDHDHCLHDLYTESTTLRLQAPNSVNLFLAFYCESEIFHINPVILPSSSQLYAFIITKQNFSDSRWDRHVAIPACFYFIVFNPGDLYYQGYF